MDRVRLQREANRSLRKVAREQMFRKYTKNPLLSSSYFTALPVPFLVNLQTFFTYFIHANFPCSLELHFAFIKGKFN